MKTIPRIAPLVSASLMFALCLPAPADDRAKGAQIFAQKCAVCHGDRGQGTDDYPEAIFGDQPTVELADYISRAMPDGEPEECTGEDALAVATWMQDAFYSPEAQARINPPRRKLSRLTVSQYRNAVADLAAGFAWTAQPDDRRGLTGRYYKSRSFNNSKKAFERLDALISFQFAEGTPDKEKIPDAEQFSINWDGSVLIDETGWYEFILKTENGAKLFVNDTTTPLIDAWVKSGYDTEYRGRIFLLAGRLYRLNLQWFTYKQKTASVALWWKPPHGVEQPVPTRFLSPVTPPWELITQTPFPPDDRSDGYERGTSVSREWFEATTLAAVEAVEKLMPRVHTFAKIGKGDSAEKKTQKLRTFCQTFAYRAFRRPLTAELTKAYVGRHFDSTTDPLDATRRSLLAILNAPEFLYREVSGEYDTFLIGERLAFALIDSLPDVTLLQAAEKNWLSMEKGVRDQAWRLLGSYRARTRLHNFLRVWLNLERIESIRKDPEVFPGFSEELVSDLRQSLEILLAEAASRDDGFRYLLTTDEFWVNPRIADFYGIPSVSGSGFTKVKYQPEYRAGVVSHPYLLAGLAYPKSTSPIHRGVFLSRSLLGRALKPPPDSVAPLAPELEPDLTTRERVIKQTSPAVCSNCHTMINSLGFALETFDAVGRYQTLDHGKPIDATGFYRQRDGQPVEFVGARQLSEFLVRSPETHRSFSRQLFHFLVQQPILAYGPETLSQLSEFFEQHEFSMRHLMVEIAVRSALFRESEDPPRRQAAIRP